MMDFLIRIKNGYEKKFQPFLRSVSIWVKVLNEVLTNEQTRCRKNYN